VRTFRESSALSQLTRVLMRRSLVVIARYRNQNRPRGLRSAAPLQWSRLPAEHAKIVHPFIHRALEQTWLVAYIGRAFVWPGGRVRYDGRPLALAAANADDPSWMNLKRDDA
jgi:hypothetical protein